MSKYKKLNPRDIGVDDRFQRDFEEKRARKMSENLDRSLIGVPVISDRGGGEYVVIDGQHRTGALKMAGSDEPILCDVHEGLTLAEEAELFLRLNGGRSAVREFDKFKAQLTAKDPVALEIAAMVKAAGMRIGKAQGKRCICAVKALQRAYHKGTLPNVLSVLVTWGSDDVDILEGAIIAALAMFLARYPEVNLLEFGKKLMPLAGERIKAQLKRARGVYGDVSPTIAACLVFREIYNARRRQKLPAPDDFTAAEAEKKNEKKRAG